MKDLCNCELLHLQNNSNTTHKVKPTKPQRAMPIKELEFKIDYVLADTIEKTTFSSH